VSGSANGLFGPGENVDWTALSPRGKAIARVIALPISQGHSTKELAAELEIPRSRVKSYLDELRGELLELYRAR
jgi:DNA-binding CsgD family transcriptional regulator